MMNYEYIKSKSFHLLLELFELNKFVIRKS